MGKVLLIIFGISLALILCYIFFAGKKGKKKKEKKKEPVAEKKVEKAIKTGKEEQPKEEKPEEKPRERIPFKIIKKQSKVKINKKALNASSRNPSITKVFDKNGKVDAVKSEPIDHQKELQEAIIETSNKEVGRFGAREQEIRTVSSDHEFSIIAPTGSPNRAPTIGDRTNFGSHLNVNEDGNLSGVLGTGIKKVDDKVNMVIEKVDDKTEDMVNRMKKNVFGITDDIDPFDFLNRQPREDISKKEQNPLKKIDAKTLIIADAISNPKYKKK